MCYNYSKKMELIIKLKLKISKFKKILIVLIILLIAISYFIGSYFVKYSLVANSGGNNRNVKIEKELIVEDEIEQLIKNNSKKEKEAGLAFAQNFKNNEVEIKSNDNLTLKGHIFDNLNNNWIIVVHGYQSPEVKYFDLAKRFYERGYSVLTVSLRGHEPSSGKYIGMGYLDKDDLNKWIDFLVEKNKNNKIILHGTSMGGATVIMTAGLSKSSNLVGVIDDCGYSDLWEIFTLELKKRFSLPSFPILNISSLVAKFKAGYFVGDVKPLEYAKNINIPTLIIHGTKDDFVPLHMSEDIFQEIKSKDKELFIVENAGHADSKYKDLDRYYSKVFEFCDKNFI